MAHYIDAEQLKAELDKRYTEYRAKMKTDDFTYYEGMADALDLFEQYIDSLPEQPVLPGIVEDERVGIPGRDFIPVEWVDACEKYGKWKIVKQEQPEVDFETEYAKFSNDPDALDYTFPIDLSDYKDFARHFYELGKNARKEDK